MPRLARVRTLGGGTGPRSSVDQSGCLLSSGSQVRILPGTPSLVRRERRGRVPAMLARLGRALVPVGSGLVALVLSHSLVYLVRYGSAYGEALAHNGHDA